MGDSTGAVRPFFLSSEVFLAKAVRHHGIAVARFPSVAMLQCCELNYRDDMPNAMPNVSLAARRCFQTECHEMSCPKGRGIGRCHPQVSRLAPGWAASPALENPRLRFKYANEGAAAIIHATALSFGGAAFHEPEERDATFPRLEIWMPRRLGSSFARAALLPGPPLERPAVFYSCFECDKGESDFLPMEEGFGCRPGILARSPPPPAGQAQLQWPRSVARWSAVRERCLLYNPAGMAAVCGQHGEAARRTELRWCADAPLPR